MDFVDVIDFFDTNRCGMLATVDDGVPRIRPWSFLFEQGGKIWFMTTNKKRVFQQLKNVPYIEFCSIASDLVSGRIGGKIEFCKDISIIERILNERPILKQIYETPQNPDLEPFYLEHGYASLYSSRLSINEYIKF